MGKAVLSSKYLYINDVKVVCAVRSGSVWSWGRAPDRQSRPDRGSIKPPPDRFDLRRLDWLDALRLVVPKLTVDK